MKKTPGNDFESRRLLQPKSSRNTKAGATGREVPTGRDRPGPEHYAGESKVGGTNPIPDPNSPQPLAHHSGQEEAQPERYRKVGTVKHLAEGDGR